VRPVEQTELLRQHGRRIAVVELDGALFFGTAEAADEEIEHLARASEFIIIDFERVGEVDASGARVLLHAADSVARAGKLLLLAGLTAQDSRTRIILDMDVHGRLDRSQFFPDTDRALEFAEDRLLDVVAPQRGGAGSALSLGATLMGRGLSEQEIALLTPLLTERRFARGEAVFRRGEPGDAMYVSLHGQIGIWLPADEGEGAGARRGRRMVTYAPGVVFGEIGLMQDRPRSADAIAEEDAVVLELTRAHYEELGRSHPALLGKLLLNIGLLLATRVRALTDELEAAQAAR
jgi:sulfate permease, SulP family